MKKLFRVFLFLVLMFGLSSGGVRANTSLYNFACLQNNACLTKADSDPNKPFCYSSCRVNFSQSPRLDKSFYAGKELKYVNEFLKYYASTNYGPLRGKATENINNFNTNYYRLVCHVAALGAIKGLVENQPASYYSYYADRLTAVFDDYNNNYSADSRFWLNDYRKAWGSTGNSGFWTSSVAGYTCGLAASLMWDKLPSNTAWDIVSGHSGRTGAQKQSEIRSKLLDLAGKVKANYSASQIKTIHRGTVGWGNSQAEEAAWNGAYLSFVSRLLPKTGAGFLEEAKQLSSFSYSHCDNNLECAMFPDFTVENHAIKPHPQYGMSVLELNAWASLPYYTFGGFNRDLVPIEFRLGKTSVYDAVNVLESNLRYINMNNFSLKGAYWFRGDPSLLWFENNVYLGRSGVSDWGTAGDFLEAPFAYLFVLDRFNWNGYQSSLSPYYFLAQSNDARLLSGSLYLPTDFVNGVWVNQPLGSAKAEHFYMLLNANVSTDGKINSHFFLNGVKAFSHLTSYLYTAPINYLKLLEQ